MRRGIILAGGAGTRLSPATNVICKQLLPVYDKPMIYYPLSTMMLAGIREIVIISTPRDLPRFRGLFGDGSAYGLQLQYAEQSSPSGIAEAFLIGADFLDGRPSCLILGDNIFYGHSLSATLARVSGSDTPATVFGYYVKDPERYGVIEFDSAGTVLSIEEKPARPRSSYAVVGMYFYDRNAVELARQLRPSARGELEITDLNNLYLGRGELTAELLGRGYAWLDTGTHESLIDAATYVKTIEERQGLKIACIEEIAYSMGYIDARQFEALAQSLESSEYGRYLRRLIDGHGAEHSLLNRPPHDHHHERSARSR